MSVVLTDVIERFTNQTERFTNEEISSEEYLEGLESDYSLLLGAYIVNTDLEPPLIYEEFHEYRLKEIESYILMYEWMIKAVEELNENYVEISFSYIEEAIYYLDLISNLDISC